MSGPPFVLCARTTGLDQAEPAGAAPAGSAWSRPVVLAQSTKGGPLIAPYAGVAASGASFVVWPSRPEDRIYRGRWLRANGRVGPVRIVAAARKYQELTTFSLAEGGTA